MINGLIDDLINESVDESMNACMNGENDGSYFMEATFFMLKRRIFQLGIHLMSSMYTIMLVMMIILIMHIVIITMFQKWL